MQKRSLIFSCLLILFVLFLFHTQQVSAQTAQEPPDVVLKITQVDKILETMDRISESFPSAGQSSPSAFLKSMLMGTDWIDPSRVIVFGVFMKKDATAPPDAAALIPFRRPNDDFLMNYNAVAGKDYYVIALPPGQGGVVSDRMEESLVAASMNPPDELISIDLAASQLISKADQQIQNMLQTLEQKMPTDAAETDLSPQQIRQMLANLVETGKQLQTVSLGLDLTDTEVSFFCNAKAIDASKLADVFDVNTGSKPLILAGYKPTYPITIRSKPYEMGAVMDFFDRNFGLVYDQIGLDFSKLKEMTKYFSGEMAGGVGFGKNGLTMEIIAVFDESQQMPENYLESVYLPWILDYGKTMAELIQEQTPNEELENLFEKMAPSTVAGQSVVGLKGKMPLDLKSDQEVFEFQMRMTRLDNMLLTASDDSKLENLIKTAQKLEKAEASGPLMQMDIDLSAYLGAIAELMPDQSQFNAEDLPELGNLTYTLDMTEGMLKSRYSMALDDIQKMTAYFKELGRAGQAGATFEEPEFGVQEGRVQAQRAKDKPDKDSPQYWINKGELFATYGNDRRAIDHYKKAIELDSNNGKAFFHLGVSYGAIGQYGQALDAINRAIVLQPDDGDNYYARGWIYLRAGNKDKAMADMKQAADMGNSDAQKYLNSIGQRY